MQYKVSYGEMVDRPEKSTDQPTGYTLISGLVQIPLLLNHFKKRRLRSMQKILNLRNIFRPIIVLKPRRLNELQLAIQ